jgi:RES domain-containing protein
MIVWRLADPQYARDLSGAGNRNNGGRWNSPGRGVVYCAENLSLCVLENIVHLPLSLRGRLPPRTAIKIEIPDQRTVDVNKFPSALRGNTLNVWCRKIGDQWLATNSNLVMRVPSVVVEQEFNVMLNASHMGMSGIKILETRRFKFDERLTQEC